METGTINSNSRTFLSFNCGRAWQSCLLVPAILVPKVPKSNNLKVQQSNNPQVIIISSSHRGSMPVMEILAYCIPYNYILSILLLSLWDDDHVYGLLDCWIFRLLDLLDSTKFQMNKHKDHKVSSTVYDIGDSTALKGSNLHDRRSLTCGERPDDVICLKGRTGGTLATAGTNGTFATKLFARRAFISIESMPARQNFPAGDARQSYSMLHSVKWGRGTLLNRITGNDFVNNNETIADSVSATLMRQRSSSNTRSTTIRLASEIKLASL